MNILLLHGAYGNPNENWFPWLKNQLKSQGHSVTIPQFPTPQNQNLKSWMKVIEPIKERLNEETIIVGHSIGAAFALSIIESLNIKIKGCILVAGFLGLLNNKEFDELNTTISNKEFNYITIRNNCEQFVVINSKDDPYVPIEKGFELANNLKTEIVPYSQGGHFNETAGFKEFPKVLDYITLIVNQDKIIVEKEDKTQLVGFKAKPKHWTKEAILLIHGFGVGKEERGLFNDITIALRENYCVYRFDFTGCGESDGDYSKITLTRLNKDLKLILDTLQKEYEKVAIIAQSLGTSSTITLHPKVDTTILMGSPIDPKERAKVLFDEFNEEGTSYWTRSDGGKTIIEKQLWSDLDSYNLKEEIKHLEGSKLFIHGTHDTIVPKEDSQTLFELANEPKEIQLIQNDNHNYSFNREQLIEIITNFLNKNFK